MFLAVPDARIGVIANELAGAGVPHGVAFIHCSGALGLAPLARLAPHHDVGSFHPLQSFPKPRPPAAFKDIVIGIDASTTRLLAQLRRLARDLGARSRRVGDADRALYHAAAVFGSNYLIVLLYEAGRILARAGWSEKESIDALVPLMQGVLSNVSRQGINRSLTGPVRRGDVETVERHLKALSKSPSTEGIYRMLGAVALEIAEASGMDAEASEQMKVALTRKVAATRRKA